jgi:hypothetical protein
MSGIVGIIVSMFLLISLGGKEITYTADKLEILYVDKLMPPNERVYNYIEEYAKIYNIPTEYVYRCAFLESNYGGIGHINFAPYKDWLVSTANAYSVLQVRVIAARDVWPRYNYMPKRQVVGSLMWFEEQLKQNKYRIKHRIPTDVKLEYISDTELAKKLRYDLRFNVETGIRYMNKLYKKYGDYATVFSFYNQGKKGVNYINAYAKYIIKVET